MARPEKKTITLKLEILPQAHKWLEVLCDKGYNGNNIESVAVNLLNSQFRHLMESGELPCELKPLDSPLKFPNTPSAQIPNRSTEASP